jgi:hypothetical protein
MIGMVQFYNTDDHTIIGGDIADFCARLVEHEPQRRGKLFVVRYNKVGTYVIAEWLANPRDIFVDVINLGTSLANFTREKAHELRKRLFAPLTAEATVQASAEAESDYNHFMNDDNLEEKERLEKVVRGE